MDANSKNKLRLSLGSMVSKQKNSSNDTKPPQWAVRLLHWYCAPDLLEEVEGDILEMFHLTSQEKGLHILPLEVIEHTHII